MQRMRKKGGQLMLFVLTLVGLLGAGGSPAASERPTCNAYLNSRVAWVEPIGYVCAYTGGWCIECYAGGTACWKDDDSEGRGPCGPYQQKP